MLFFSEKHDSAKSLFEKYKGQIFEDLSPRGLTFGFLTDSNSNNVCMENIDLPRLEKRAAAWLKAPVLWKSDQRID